MRRVKIDEEVDTVKRYAGRVGFCGHSLLLLAVLPVLTVSSALAVKTDRWDSLQRQQAAAAGKDLEIFEKEQSRNFPLGRIALPEEVADLVCFLASERASFLTGVAITIDGGMSRGVYL